MLPPLLNIKNFIRLDGMQNLVLPNELYVNCYGYVKTPLLTDSSNKIATTEWVKQTSLSLGGFTTTNLAEGTNLYWTDARFDTRFSYKSTSDLQEGTNLYFTNARARTAISLTTIGTSGAATYDSVTGVLNIPSYIGGVTSVNTKTGAVTLTTSDITEGTNLYYTDARAISALTQTLTGYVPYTGATSNVNLGNNSLTVDQIAVNKLVFISPIALVGISNGGTVARITNSEVLTLLGVSPTSYVPYTGATNNVNLGTNTLTAGLVYSTGNIQVAKNILYAKYGKSVAAAGNMTTYAPTGTASAFGFIDGNSGFATEFNFDNTDDRSYTFPAASGTLALTSNLNSYVPYTGATSNVNLGTNTLTAGLLKSTGNIQIAKNAIYDKFGLTGLYSSGTMVTYAPTGTNSSFGFLDGDSGFKSVFNFDNTGDKTYTFPAASGTIALTSNLNSYVPYTGATANVDLGVYTLTTRDLTVSSSASSYISLISTATNGKWWTLNSATNGNFYIGINAGSAALSINTSNKVDFGGTIGNGTYTYTLPSANGTLALTSNLSSYVPYTGATGDVNLGTSSLLSKFVYVEGDGTQGGMVSFKQYATSFGTSTGRTNTYATGTSKIHYNFSQTGSGVKQFDFDVSGITLGASRTYTMPDASGTLALTSNLSSYVPTSRTLTINGTTYDLSADRTWTINSMVYPSAGIAVSTGTAWGTSIVDNSTNWNSAYTDRMKWDGGSTGLVAATGRTSLGLGTAATANTGDFAAASHTHSIANVTGLQTALDGKEASITAGTTAQYWRGDKTWQTLPSYSLPTASATVLGGIKVGTNLSIDANGVLSSTDTNTTYVNFTRTASGLVPNPGAATTNRYLREDGTWVIPPDNDTVYTHPTTAGNKHIPAGGATGQILRWSADGTAVWGADTDTWNANSKDVAGYVSAPGAVANKVWKTDALGNPGWRDDADTDTNTWNANSKDVAGYVSAPGAVANKVWKTDASGNPGWRDDADTDTNTTYSAGAGLTLTGTTFSVTKSIDASQTADTIALRNSSGQLVATGFYQASSRALKTNINPFTKSALDIIRDVTVVSFNYKKDVITKHIGFIAEDTPEELSTRHKNVMDANNTIGVLLKAVQELEAKIKILESK